MTLIEDKEKYCEDRRNSIKDEYPYPKMISFKNDTGYKGMVVVKNIEFSTKCEHHLVPIKGECHIGYIPKTKLVGLSQFARVVEWFCNPTTSITQEKANQDVLNFIEKKSKPLGVIVIMQADHECASSRGVKQRNMKTITSSISGVFKTPPKGKNPKEEFMDLLKI